MRKILLSALLGISLFTSSTKADVPSFHQIFHKHEGNVSDKWENYLDVYEEIFKPYQNSKSPIQILEIGVQNGGSLQIWEAYFGPKTQITGIDIEPKTCSLKLGKNITTLCFDGSDAKKLNANLGNGQYDFIIDDGSHLSSHVINSFNALFSRVKPGGIFIIEDACTSYWDNYEGGLRKQNSSIEYFKGLIDLVNRYHVRDAQYETNLTAEEKEFCKWIKKIEFRDSMVLIYKLDEPRGRPYVRLVTGRDAPVAPQILETAKKEGWYVKDKK